MPLAGTGAVMGALILASIGNPDPKAIPAFSTLGDTIGLWVIPNVDCKPGTMVSAGAAVSGFGALKAVVAADDLGSKLAVAMKDPSPDGIKTWTKFAKALISHFETYGQIVSSFAAPVPAGGPLTGTGKVAFTSPVFVPPLASQLGVADAAAGAMLEVFGSQILAHIAATAVVVPLTTNKPLVPYTGPPGGGKISGAGAIT